MSVLKFIKDFSKAVSETIKDIYNDLNANIDTNSGEYIDLKDLNPVKILENLSSGVENSKVPSFPKIELIGTKGNKNKGIFNQLNISDYQKKYIIESLQKKVDSMTNQEKAYIYYYLGYKHKQIRNILGSNIEEADIAMKYLDKALELYPDNIDFAYEYFQICFRDDLCCCRKKVIDICELCIKLSNNQDVKNEFHNIYYLMGKYYYLEEKIYTKALECFNKAIEYSKNIPPDQILYIYQYLVILHDIVGNYNEALKICDFILGIKSDYFDISEMRTKITNKIKAGIKVEDVDRKNYISNMNFHLKNAVGRYPEKYLEEAYEHYLNAQKLVQSGKRLQAIKEYLLVKELIPEESEQLNDLISMHISIGLSQKTEGMDTDLLLECLFENLKSVSASGNQKELARIYNALGCAYSDIKNYEKAVEYYKKSVSIIADPYHYSNLAICYTSMGKYNEAIAIYEKIKKFAPQTEEHLKPDFHIQHIKDIIAGKVSPNEKIKDNTDLADEHNKKGDLYFDNHNYENAQAKYKAAFGIKPNHIEYLFKILLCKNIYESPYYEESENGFKSLKLCADIDDFKYLPFLCTVYGDALSYEAWGKGNLSLEYYEIAVFLLDMVPTKERFAAPYYKLGRLKEESKKYNEALKLFEQTKEIDSNYDVEEDINRIQNLINNNEKSINNEFENHYKLIKKYQDSKLYKALIVEGKKALEYSPNNIEIYYLITKAAKQLSMHFEEKWAAKEGLRLDLDKYDEKNLFDKFILILGKCCKNENKKEQAKFYFNIILDCDENPLSEIHQEARKELDYLNLNLI